MRHYCEQCDNVFCECVPVAKVETLDEIMKRAYPKPATHDPLCHMAATVDCRWWGWWEVQHG